MRGSWIRAVLISLAWICLKSLMVLQFEISGKFGEVVLGGVSVTWVGGLNELVFIIALTH